MFPYLCILSILLIEIVLTLLGLNKTRFYVILDYEIQDIVNDYQIRCAKSAPLCQYFNITNLQMIDKSMPSNFLCLQVQRNEQSLTSYIGKK